MQMPVQTLVVAGMAGLLLAADVTADDSQDRVAASREAVKQFATSLKSELMQAMEAGGPVNAIDTCKLVAPAIAREVSSRRGWDVGRTSLRVRNPANAPDEWERRILEDFEASRRDGADPATLEHFEVVGAGEQRRFRYMKAIPTADLCLACHGSNLSPAVREALAREYPQDRATGFSAGDIRGAFTVTQPL